MSVTMTVYKCKVCGKIHYKKYARDRHEKIHYKKPVSLKCNHYDKEYSRLDNLRRHQREQHGKNMKIYDITCLQCKKVFEQKGNIFFCFHTSH